MNLDTIVLLFLRRAIVEELVGFGARVHTCCRNGSELDKCLEDWNDIWSGGMISGSVCDVSVGAQRQELMETVSLIFGGKLNILVSSFIISSFFLHGMLYIEFCASTSLLSVKGKCFL